MKTVDYADPTTDRASGVTVVRTSGVLSITWPAEPTQSRRVGAYGNLLCGLVMVVLSGCSPSFVQRLLRIKVEGISYSILAVGVLWTVQGVRGCWRVHRWPTVVQTLTVTRERVTLVRMGIWRPRLLDRPASDVLVVSWSPASRFLWGNNDPMALTMRFICGRRLQVTFLGQPSGTTAVVLKCVHELIPSLRHGGAH